MNYLNQILFLLAQNGPSPTGDAPPAGVDPAAPAAETSIFSNLLMFAPAILGVMLVYFLLSGKPQKKQQAKAQELLENIKKNDRVVTAGGILGTVVNKDNESDYVTLRVDDSSNTKMQILKASIVRVVSDEATKVDAKP